MNLTVVVLTYNEALHIERCLLSFSALQARVVVVDSYSSDNTVQLSHNMGADVFQNPFVNQAQQFNWAMSNCGIDSKWVLRLDADETIDEQLCLNIRGFIELDPKDCNGAILNRKHIFLGKWVRFGGRYPLPMLRLFRRGFAHIEQRWMDEHIVLESGNSVMLKGGFEDNNLNSISWFIDKHNAYATREMVDLMLKRYSSTKSEGITEATGLSIRLKRFFKEGVYNRLPYFVRPALYFAYRYFVLLGFLDGARGFGYHFMQAFWYRALVDLKCLEFERISADCVNSDEKLLRLESHTGYKFDHP